MLVTEMTPQQKAALDLYLEVDDDYKAPSFKQIAEALTASGIQVTKSTVQRWSKACGFDAYLTRHVNALVAADDEKNAALQDEATGQNYKKTLMTLEENAQLLHGSHELLLKVIDQILETHKKTNKISKDDKKLILSIYKETAAREDRLHDRQAMLKASDLIGKSDLLKQLGVTDIEVEPEYIPAPDSDAIDADIEIED